MRHVCFVLQLGRDKGIVQQLRSLPKPMIPSTTYKSIARFFLCVSRLMDLNSCFALNDIFRLLAISISVDPFTLLVKDIGSLRADLDLARIGLSMDTFCILPFAQGNNKLRGAFLRKARDSFFGAGDFSQSQTFGRTYTRGYFSVVREPTSVYWAGVPGTLIHF